MAYPSTREGRERSSELASTVRMSVQYVRILFERSRLWAKLSPLQECVYQVPLSRAVARLVLGNTLWGRARTNPFELVGISAGKGTVGCTKVASAGFSPPISVQITPERHAHTRDTACRPMDGCAAMWGSNELSGCKGSSTSFVRYYARRRTVHGSRNLYYFFVVRSTGHL